ncbi:MFS transporter [Patescibacteria group bacterium]|nr:MFS transporter [Patescibacteria group bacterium]
MPYFRYLNHHLTRQLNELYISTVIFGLAQSMIMIFIPIYLYQLGYSLGQILLYFTFHYAAYAILMLITGKIIIKIGYEASIGWSIPLYGIYLASLFLIPTFPILFYISAGAWALHKAMYWPAFHADFTEFGNIKARGEEISSMKVLVGMVSILGPTIGGFILMHSGFTLIFIIVMALSFASLIPLLMSKEKFEPGEFSIKKMVLGFFKSRYRKDIIANLGTGEDVIAQTVWPIFLLTMLANYQDVGVITTIALFVAFLVILIMGKLANRPARTRLIKITSAVVSLSWLVRLFSFNWLSIFASDALYKASKRTLDVPIQALIYSRPKDRPLYYIIFREIALSLGKVIAALLAYIVIVLTGQMLLTFALAAVLTLFYFYWTDQIASEKIKG